MLDAQKKEGEAHRHLVELDKLVKELIEKAEQLDKSSTETTLPEPDILLIRRAVAAVTRFKTSYPINAV